MAARKLILAALLTGAVTLTAACAGNSDSTTDTTAAGNAGSPRYGGTMTVAYQSDPKTFDPAVCYDATCWNNMRMLYDRLYDYTGDTMTIAPQAASADPEVSADGMTYTIKLRSGMTFSDGKPVTAKDFVYSFGRIFDPATKSPVLGFWTSVAGGAKGITAVDDTTLQIKLTAPNSAFKYVLAMPHASVVEDGSASKPVGSGPFTLDHFTPGQEIVVKRNAKYWDAPKPYVDEVVEKLGVDSHVALLSLEKGSIDLMGDPIPAADYLSVANNASLKAQTKTIVKPSTYFVTMNTKVKPFDNAKVREAVSYAFDRSFLLKLVAGQGQPANEYLPPGITGYTSEKLVHDQDLAKAKQLLAEAGFPNGFSTTMYSWNTSPWTALLPQLQQDLAKIGITVDAKPVQQSAFFDVAGTPGKAPMTLTFWVADYPDASDFYQALLSCAAAIPGGQNYPFYCNKNVDDLVNKALAAKDTASATEIYTQATKAMLADNPVVPLYYGSKTEVFGKTVGGYHSQPIWGWDMTNYWKTTGAASR